MLALSTLIDLHYVSEAELSLLRSSYVAYLLSLRLNTSQDTEAVCIWRHPLVPIMKTQSHNYISHTKRGKHTHHKNGHDIPLKRKMYHLQQQHICLQQTQVQFTLKISIWVRH